jgi:hypothetical protein
VATESLCFLVLYLGRWPRWIELFLRGCAANPGIRFWLLGDHPLPVGALPPNVSVGAFSYEDFRERARRTLGIDVPLHDAHKLCDFKPFFAILFADLLGPHRFWGYCDIDLIFGDLSPMIREEFLEGVDVFTAYDRYPVGHFTFLRNCPPVNGLACEIEGWREKLRHPRVLQLDEGGGIQAVLERHPEIRWHRIEDVAADYAKERSLAGFTVIFDGRGDRLEAGYRYRAVWQRGRTHLHDDLARRVCEVSYIHFMGLKRKVHWRNFSGSETYTECTFTSTGFHGHVMTAAEWHGARESLWRLAVRTYVLARARAGRILQRRHRKTAAAWFARLLGRRAYS